MALYCILGFILISICGSILHFVYDWLKHFKHISFLVAVNESTWEHLKLGVLPTFVWALFGINYGFNNFEFAIFIAVLSIIVIIPAIFYSYTSITHKPILAVDILSFFIAIMFSMFFSYLIMNATEFSFACKIIGIIGSSILTILFIVFTYIPPRIFLFKDPISQKYGIKGHFDDEKFGNKYSIKDKK